MASPAIGPPQNVKFDQGRSFFEPCFKGRSEGVIEAAVIGRHNVKNALAVYAMGRTMGIAARNCSTAFALSKGSNGAKKCAAKSAV